MKQSRSEVIEQFEGELRHQLLNLTSPLKASTSLLSDRLKELIDTETISISDREGARSIHEVLEHQLNIIALIEAIPEMLTIQLK